MFIFFARLLLSLHFEYNHIITEAMKKFWDFLKNHRIITTLLSMLLITIVLFILLNIWLNAYTRHNDVRLLPSVKYLSIEEASQVLQRYGLRYEIIDSVYNEKATPGVIMDQIPQPDSKIKEGRIIYLTINAFNPRTIKLPNLINTSARQARAQLASLGFKNIEISYQPSPYKDLVLSVKYKGKELSGGEYIGVSEPVTLVVGEGETEDDENVTANDSLHEEIIIEDFF